MIRPPTLLVTVPASAGNLGPGLGCLGLALSLRNRVLFEPGGDRIAVTLAGSAIRATEFETGERNLTVRAMELAWDEFGRRPGGGVRVRIEAHIPAARGLGSSAAAVVAGLLGALHLIDETLDTADLLLLATRLEPRLEHLTPCLLGGFTLCVGDGPQIHARKLPFPKELRITLAIPETPLSERCARTNLPPQVNRADAEANIARTALLVASLLAGGGRGVDPAHLALAMEDRLVQPHRKCQVPGAAEIFLLSRARTDFGVALSGEGTSFIFLHRDPIDPVLERVREIWERYGVRCMFRPVSPCLDGAIVERLEDDWKLPVGMATGAAQ